MTSSTLNDFAQSLAPSAYDKTRVSQRRAAMAIATGTSSLSAGTWFESGSWTHGTSVAGHSDVDFMARARGPRPVNPSSALATLKDALAGSHGDIYRQRISSPTVKVEFFGDPDFEVVPAWPAWGTGIAEVFLIPGPHDEWTESAPNGHLHFVNQQNDRLNKRVKPMVRLLKQWKAHVKAPVSSFYLEMRVAEYAKSEDIMLLHAIDLPALMGRLIDRGLCDMNDPTHLVSRIKAVSSEDNRAITVRLLEDAKKRLDAAYLLSNELGQQMPHHALMTEVFGSSFPWPTW